MSSGSEHSAQHAPEVQIHDQLRKIKFDSITISYILGLFDTKPINDNLSFRKKDQVSHSRIQIN